MSKLLAIQDWVNYYLHRKSVKLSRNFAGLGVLIRAELNKDIINGDVFIFLNQMRSMSMCLYMIRRASISSTEGLMEFLPIVGGDISYRQAPSKSCICCVV